MASIGWEVHDCMSADEWRVFDEATKGLVGVKYTPKTVATQVVAGTDYCFVCTTKVVSSFESDGISAVYVFKGLEESEAAVYKIEPLLDICK